MKRNSGGKQSRAVQQSRASKQSRVVNRRVSTNKKSAVKKSPPKKKLLNVVPTVEQTAVNTDPIKMGFVRGVSPDKWVKRWHEVRSRKPLEIVPIAHGWDPHHSDEAKDCDLLLVRVQEGSQPEDAGLNRHAVAMYTEKLGLIISKAHELADQASASAEDLELLNLLDYEGYDSGWPEPQLWQDPSYRPKNLNGALDLVKAGLGSTLAPLPLARLAADKREHRVLEVTAELPSATIFATWLVDRDGNDIQELIGVLRGRRSRSSR